MSHSHCKHQFKFCAQCDMVWCGSCSQEWGGHAHASYPWYTYTVPNWIGTTGGTFDDTGANVVTSHASHDLSSMHADAS